MKWKSEDGAIIVEATISLSTFMFFIVTILTIVNICYVQSRMSIVINETAKELSQYAYIYHLTGLNDAQENMAQAGADAKEKTNNIIDGVGGLISEVDGLKSANSVNAVQQSVENGRQHANAVADEFKSIAEDPVAFLKSLGALFANEAAEELKSQVIAQIAKAMAKEHLVSSPDGDCESYLKSLGVVPKGNSYLQGVNFKLSEIYPMGNDGKIKNEIKIVAVYRAKVVPLLPIDMQFTFCQTAQTRGWCGAD